MLLNPAPSQRKKKKKKKKKSSVIFRTTTRSLSPPLSFSTDHPTHPPLLISELRCAHVALCLFLVPDESLQKNKNISISADKCDTEIFPFFLCVFCSCFETYLTRKTFVTKSGFIFSTTPPHTLLPFILHRLFLFSFIPSSLSHTFSF